MSGLWCCVLMAMIYLLIPNFEKPSSPVAYIVTIYSNVFLCVGSRVQNRDDLPMLEEVSAQGLLLPFISRPPSLGSKGDSVWRQWSLTLLSAVSGGYYYPPGNRSKAICSWQLEVSQSCNWSLVRTWGGAGRRGTFITPHISISGLLLTC